MRTEHIQRHRGLVAAAVAASLGAVFAHDARAADFTQGSVSGSWDTTLSYGQSWRLADRDCNLIATADGGCGRSPNIDDGDLNYGKGTFSKALKAVTELSLNFKDTGGVFVRGDGLYDFEVMDQKTERTPLSP